MMGLLLDGTDEIARAFQSAFPLHEASVDIALDVGNRVFEQVTGVTDAPAAARQAVAMADLLRVHLSRVRILAPMGDADAGKSTLLRKVYGVDVRAGLSSANRTSTLSLHRHPAYDAHWLPAYVMDVPGCGDAVRARQDIVKFAGMVVPVFLVK